MANCSSPVPAVARELRRPTAAWVPTSRCQKGVEVWGFSIQAGSLKDCMIFIDAGQLQLQLCRYSLSASSFLDFISWNAHLSLLSDTALCRFMILMEWCCTALPALPAYLLSEAPCFPVAFWLQSPWWLHTWGLLYTASDSSSLKRLEQSGHHCELQICVEYIRESVQHKSLMVSGKCLVTWNTTKLFKVDSYQFQWVQLNWNSQSMNL